MPIGKIKSLKSILPSIVVVLIILCIFYLKPYVIKMCQNKYGLSYNERRKVLSIPIIPSTWHIKERNDVSIWWTGKENIIGHKRKSVIFSGCSIEGELDVYTLPLQNGKKRLLEIEYKYAQDNQKASVVYTYQIDHSAKVISKIITDSIFKAENINKDY